MSTVDKLKNTVDEVAGKAKEALGKLTDDDVIEKKGKADQAAADLKQAGEKAKDAFKH